MSIWQDLTPVQADAVRTTAAALRRDPDELAAELRPLLVATGSSTTPRTLSKPQQQEMPSDQRRGGPRRSPPAPGGSEH